ncbi:hypothetical protein EDB19DRAFT_1726487 [Suillus lakei]|nr:hypothetical protein EDB19DRAFT_1726487 [Suillus lakei]
MSIYAWTARSEVLWIVPAIGLPVLLATASSRQAQSLALLIGQDFGSVPNGVDRSPALTTPRHLDFHPCWSPRYHIGCAFPRHILPLDGIESLKVKLARFEAYFASQRHRKFLCFHTFSTHFAVFLRSTSPLRTYTISDSVTVQKSSHFVDHGISHVLLYDVSSLPPKHQRTDMW